MKEKRLHVTLQLEFRMKNTLLVLITDFHLKYLHLLQRDVATLTAQGILTYTAPDYLSGGNPFNTSLMYEYTDGGGLTTTNIVPITIANSVPTPVADTFYVGVNQTINISAANGVLANDPSPPNSTSRAFISSTPNLALSSTKRI